MLKIRLQRFGRKHEPVFRVVLTDSKNSTKSGKFIENLGSYDSRKGEEAVMKSDRISYWVSKGAQLSDTMNNLLISKKIIEGKKINNLPKKKPILKEAKEEIAKVAETPSETPTSETVKVEEAPVPVKEESKIETKAEVPSEEVKMEGSPKTKVEEDTIAG